MVWAANDSQFQAPAVCCITTFHTDIHYLLYNLCVTLPLLTQLFIIGYATCILRCHHSDNYLLLTTIYNLRFALPLLTVIH